MNEEFWNKFPEARQTKDKLKHYFEKEAVKDLLIEDKTIYDMPYAEFEFLQEVPNLCAADKKIMPVFLTDYKDIDKEWDQTRNQIKELLAWTR